MRCRGDNPADYLPVPFKKTKSVPKRVLSAMAIVPKRRPLASGVNVTASVQLCDGARLVPAAQVVPAARAKSPVVLTFFRMRGDVPEFVSVTLSGALVVSRRCVPKFNSLVLNEARG